MIAGEEGITTIERKNDGSVDVEQTDWNDVEWDNGHYYENDDGAAFVAGAITGIAIGAMLSAPPPVYTTVVVTGSTYYYADGYYYEPVYHETQVVYQVVPPPGGAIIMTLPPGCVATIVNGIPYSLCGMTYYTRVQTGYQVVVIH